MDAFRRMTALHTHPAIAAVTSDPFAAVYGERFRQVATVSRWNRILTDGHAPSQYRALTVRNLDPWYSAFHVASGDKLYLAPGDRVRVW